MNFRNLFSTLTVIFALLLAPPAYALPKSAAGLGVDLGAFGGWGKMKDSLDSIKPTNMVTFGGYILPRYSFSSYFGVGAYGEFSNAGQRTEPAEVDDVNKTATGYLLGPAVVLNAGQLRLTAAYSLMGKSTLKKKTSEGLSSTLEAPKGLHLIVGLWINPWATFDLAIANVKYDVMVGTTTTPTGTRTWTDFRLGGSAHF